MIDQYKISLVIPVYNVGISILKLLEKIPNFIDQIYVIDDNCPMKTGNIILENNTNLKNVKVILNKTNLGVGGAVKVGYLESIKDSFDITVKIDGDDQMNPNEIDKLLQPIISEKYGYTKGNRFINQNEIENYPRTRFYGNIFLSFISKLSSGYWDIFDPINGFTAIKTEILKKINLEKIDNRYFFETDMLYSLYLVDIKIKDVPVEIKYNNNQVQNLNVTKEAFNFLFKNIHRTFSRIKNKYFLHNFSITSFFCFSSLILFLFAICFGGFNWIKYGMLLNKLAPTGIVILSISSLTLSLLFFGVFLYLDSLNNPNNKND